MFQKISAKPNKVPLTPKLTPSGPEPAPSKKGIDPAVKAGLAGEIAQEGINKGLKVYQGLKESQNAADNFIGKVLDNAQRMGLNAEKLNIELGEREVLISQLLSTMPEPLLATYFDEFLFKKDIPWALTREIMQKAVDAEKEGASAKDVLDFGLVFLSQRQNYGNTISIIDTALDLQPQMRNINIFKYLKDNLAGKRSADLSWIMMDPDQIDNAVLLNRLMGMVHARGAEDLEVYRRRYEKLKLEVRRKREIADRVRAVYDGMLSMEFMSALKRNVQFVTEQFQLGTKDPLINSFAKILYDLKLGQEFRSELFAPLEGRTTAEETPGLSQQRSTSMTRSVRSNNDHDFIKISQNKKTYNQNYIQNLVKFINQFKIVNDQMINKINKSKVQIKDQNELAFANDTLNKLNAITPILNTSIKNISDQSNVQVGFNTFIQSLKTYDTILQKLIQSGIKPQNLSNVFRNATNQSNSFVKLAQVPTNLPVNPETGITGRGSSGPNQSVAGAEGKFLADDAAKIAQEIFQVGGATSAAVAFATGDWKGALALGTALLLQAKNKNLLQISNDLKLDVPVDETPQEVLQEAAEAFSQLTDNAQEIREYQANDQFIQSISKNIGLMENNLLLSIKTQVKTVDGEATTPLASPERAKKLYDDFVEYLYTAADQCRRQYDLVYTVVMRVKPNPKSRQYLAFSQKYIQLVNSSLKAIEKKISEYYSWDIVIKNAQKQEFLAMFLRKKFPEIDKYLSVGLSLADVLGSEGGILKKLKEIIDLERDSFNKLFAEYEKLKKDFPEVNIPNSQIENINSPTQVTVPVTSFSQPSQTESQGVVVNSQGDMREGGNIVTSMLFSNLIFEKNVKLAAVDPKQQAKYNYYINKANSPNINLQKLLLAMQNDYTFLDLQLRQDAEQFIKNKGVGNFVASVGLTPGSSFTQSSIPLGGIGNTGISLPNTYQGSANPGGLPAEQTGASVGVGTTSNQSTLSTPAEVQRFNNFKELYEEVGQQFGNHGILPSLETLRYQPELMAASIRAQLLSVNKRINEMEQMYYEIMKNPESLGQLKSTFGSQNLSKFIKLADLKTIEDKNKEVEADLELENYWNDLLPGIGTALEHSPKYRNKTTDELPVHKHPKFKKV